MQIADSAIVFGSIAVKDNGSVVKVFTENNGLVSLYVSGSGKKKATRNAILQPLSYCDIEFVANKRSTLSNLKLAKLNIPLFGIQGDIVKNTVALFLADVLNKIVPEERDPELFTFLKNAILLFNEMETGVANFHVAFLIRLTKWLGFYPYFLDENYTNFDLKEGVFMHGKPNHPHYLEADETRFLARFLQEDWLRLGEIKLQGKDRLLLLRAVITFYSLHIPNFREPKSLAILEEVFS